MPLRGPEQSYQNVRNYAEKWQWEDPKTKILTTGYMVPASARKKQRVPIFVRYVTLKGDLECGNVVTLKVNPRRHQRLVQFVDNPSAIRVINDYLIISIDGTRFVTH